MLQVALWSALAVSSQVRLLPEDAAPRQELHPELHFAAGAAAAIVAVPASLYLGEWLGSLSNSLIWSALPVLLCIGLIPPIAVTLATVIAGNWNNPGRYRWAPAFLATLVINGASLAIAGWLGLSVGVFSRVVIFSLMQAVLQPGAAVLIERQWPRTEPAVITLASDPVAPRTFVVPTGTWSF